MSETYALPNPPEWLERVAVRVDERVQQEAGRRQFEARLKEWRAQWRHNENRFFPSRALTVPEAYARLAALHAVVVQGSTDLDIWRYEPEKLTFSADAASRPAGDRLDTLKRQKERTPFAWLCRLATEIGDRDRARAERCLARVEADMEQAQPGDAGPGRSLEDGRRAAEWPTVYSVTKMLEMTGLSDKTLSKYARMAGVRTPGHGKRNHNYPHDDARRILEAIIGGAGDRSVKDRCREALDSLKPERDRKTGKKPERNRKTGKKPEPAK